MQENGNVTGVTRIGQNGADCGCKTAQDAAFLRETLGTWRAVADALAPYHKASAAAWWAVSKGQKITKKKAAAIDAYIDRDKPRRAERRHYARPCLDDATAAALDARRLPHESRAAALRRLLAQRGE